MAQCDLGHKELVVEFEVEGNMMINQDLLDFSQSVGDPFVETGRRALVAFSGKDKFQSIEELQTIINQVTDVYTSLTEFFYIAPKYSKDTKNWIRGKTNNLDTLFSGAVATEHCSICARSGVVHLKNGGRRDNFPMGFAGTTHNFLDHFSHSFKVCARCWLSIQFLPLNTQALSMKTPRLVLITGDKPIMEYWTAMNMMSFNRLLAEPNSKGLIEVEAKTLEGFLFALFTEMAEDDKTTQNDVTVYKFSNMGASADIDISVIPKANVNFLKSIEHFEQKGKMITQVKLLWKEVINKSYYGKSIRYEENKLLEYESKQRQKKGQKTTEWILKGDATEKRGMRIGRNYLIERFIIGDSILGIIRNKLVQDIHIIKKAQAKEKALLYRMLTFKYLKEVTQVEKSRLDFMKDLASKLSTLENAKSILGEIGRAKRSAELRAICIRAMKKYFDAQKEKLMTVEDFVYRLFPVGVNVLETRDILIVAMYEHLADQMVQDDEMSIEVKNSEENQND